MKRFEGKAAIVTGAASGIGRASALRLAAEGAHVFACDIAPDGLAEFETEAKDAGSNVATHVLDVSDADACRAAIALAVETCGKLDVLCNIAGIARLDHMTSFTDEHWHRMLGVNLSSVFFLSQAAVPHLLATKGNIVNMASSAGLEGQAYNTIYCATKAAVVMLTKSMAVEYGKQGLRVNAICPGAVITPLTRAVRMPEGGDAAMFGRMMPLLPLAQPEEIATVVAYLASDEARFVTGATFSIDGGQTAG